MGRRGVAGGQSDGTWLSVDPRNALQNPEETRTYDIDLGPLGWAAAISHDDGTHGPVPQQVVHSVDGAALSVVPLGDVDRNATLGVAVTADAVLVRITTPSASDPATPLRQEVLVGTPRG